MRVLTLVAAPIWLWGRVWITPDAFVGPDVAIFDGAVIPARSSVFHDAPLSGPLLQEIPLYSRRGESS